MTDGEFTARFVPRLADIDAAAWDALHDGANPFVAHAFLNGLERHGCLRQEWGWSPLHLTLWQGDALVAAAPGYLKGNSHGEFVFDHAWARAYAQHGLDYFPKWLCAVPYSPVTGPRLLGAAAFRPALLEAAQRLCAAQDWSSAHVNFHREDEDGGFDGDWLLRLDVQYHWRNHVGWTNFAGFLAALDHKHRKNIRQERAKVERSGVTLRVVHGDEATTADLDAMHAFYLQTFAEYGNHPALTRAFLQHLADAMPRSLVLFLADRDGRPIAGALCLRGADTLYGRYWGATEQVPGLHFEVCYYQGIEYCLREGLRVFEPGAQGEHKLARGFMPTFVRSRHWVARDDFRDALAAWCLADLQATRRYAKTLLEHSPYRSADAPAPARRPRR